MLRAVRMKNFIQFENDTFIPFPVDGAYFFVGENGSGKTSVFEAVRRCLNLELSTSFSTASNKTEMYIICEYQLPNEQPFEKYKTLFTSLVQFTEDTERYGKVVVFLKKEDDTRDVFMEIVTKTSDVKEYKVANIQINLNEEETFKLKTTLPVLTVPAMTKPKESHELEEYLKCVKNIMMRSVKTTEEGHLLNDTDVERTLKALNKYIVNTFNQRAIGPLQWSKSVRIKQEERESNYSLARTRCEIITAFLTKKHEYNEKTEEQFFKALTGESNIIFHPPQSENDSITVSVGEVQIELLKVPQGILEAKNVSLLLSSTTFRTILLEEPDNGMHPQMIQKVRDIVLPQIEDKVIIITTHNPAFIDALTIYKTIKFYRDEKTSRAILVGQELENTKKERHKTARLVASEEYPNILFARRVLFVEGIYDYLFIKNLFSHLLDPLKKDSIIKILEKARIGENNDDRIKCLNKLRDLIASLHVVSMAGEKSKCRWNDVCQVLKIPRIFLLDMDAVVEKDLKSVPELVSIKVRDELLSMLKGNKTNKNHSDLVDDLQRKAWMSKAAIEDDIERSEAADTMKERLQRLSCLEQISGEDAKAYSEYCVAVSKKSSAKIAEKFKMLDGDVVIEYDLNSLPDSVIEEVRHKLVSMLKESEIETNPEQLVDHLHRIACETNETSTDNTELSDADEAMKKRLKNLAVQTDISDEDAKTYRKYCFAVSKRFQMKFTDILYRELVVKYIKSVPKSVFKEVKCDLLAMLNESKIHTNKKQLIDDLHRKAWETKDENIKLKKTADAMKARLQTLTERKDISDEDAKAYCKYYFAVMKTKCATLNGDLVKENDLGSVPESVFQEVKNALVYMLKESKIKTNYNQLVNDLHRKTWETNEATTDNTEHSEAAETMKERLQNLTDTIDISEEDSKAYRRYYFAVMKIKCRTMGGDAVKEKDLKSIQNVVLKEVKDGLVPMLKESKTTTNHSQFVDALHMKAWKTNETTMDTIELSEATIAIKKRLQNLNEGKDISDEDAKAYRRYYLAVSETFQMKIPETFTISMQPEHLITKLTSKQKPNDNSRYVSNNALTSFEKYLEKYNWKEARNSLQDEGVFVWKEGSLEDSFMEIILETEDGISKEEQMRMVHSRYKTFSTLNIQLDLTKFQKTKKERRLEEPKPGSRPSKLYMDDKITVDDIKKSIEMVLELCSYKADIVHFIAFLARCANGDVNLLPNME